MVEYYKTGEQFDYFIKCDDKFYYLNYCDEQFNQIKREFFEYVPKDCLPEKLVSISIDDIKNARPEFAGDTLDDLEDISGCYIYRNKLSVIHITYSIGDFVENEADGELNVVTKSKDIYLNRCGRIDIISSLSGKEIKQESKYIPFDEMKNIFAQVESLISQADQYCYYVDDQGGSIELHYENKKSIKVRRGLEDTHHKDIYGSVRSLLSEYVSFNVYEGKQ